MDIVQDAMFTLAKNYSEKSAEDWPALFHRILQNKIRDWYRRTAVFKKIFFWQNTVIDDDEVIYDAVDERQLPAERLLASQQLGSEIDKALSSLPLRQQQAFLLRSWEGFNTKQTAEAMQISEGSVKTHYSRALSTLREKLSEHHIGDSL